MCRLRSTSAYYKAIIEAQVGKKTVEIHKNKTLYRQNKKKRQENRNVNEVLGQKP